MGDIESQQYNHVTQQQYYEYIQAFKDSIHSFMITELLQDEVVVTNNNNNKRLLLL